MIEIPLVKFGTGQCNVKGMVLARHKGEGVYPSILSGLFSMRKVVKAEMEHAKD